MSTEDVWNQIESERAEALTQLQRYLEIPSVSTDPAYSEDVARCAAFLRDLMAQQGLDAEILETDGHPLVYGEWLGAEGAPTLLFYGHYDVQPPDPVEEWRHDPFEPTVEPSDHEGERIVARGATDDKGQSLAHLLAVGAALRARGSLPVNVKFLVEGEEECGGASIEAFVRSPSKDRLACDAVVVSDSSMFGPGQPSVLYGLKGLLYTEIRVRGPNRDLHSGSFGGAVTNPLNALGQIIAQLRDGVTGRILIPDFYDAVRPLEEWEREEFAALPWDEDQYREALGLDALFGEEGYTTLERVWARPTCDVNGIWGGYQGAGAKTVIAAAGGAKVSMRLVPDQDPDAIATSLRSYLERIAPPGIEVELEVLSAAGPLVMDPQGPLFEAALDAMEDVWGRRPVRVREGGSIPIVSTFVEELAAPVLLLGFGLADDRLHAPNEKFELPNFYGGIRATARLLDRVAETAA